MIILGYTGQNCSEEIITCESSPCENGASCADNHSGYVCNCTSGYIGKKCDVRVDPCLSHNVCQNGSTCQNGSCVCSPFFTGFDCGKGMNMTVLYTLCERAEMSAQYFLLLDMYIL